MSSPTAALKIAYQLGKVLHRGHPFERPRIGNEDHFERGVPLLAHCVCPFNDPAAFEAFINCFSFSSTQMGIHAHFVSDHPSEELIDRNTQRFGSDVATRLLDARDCRHPDGTDTEVGVTVKDLPKEVDAGWIAAKDHGLEILDAPGHGTGFPFHGGLAPTMQAGNVCLYFDKDPIAHVRVDDNCFDICNFHYRPDRFLRTSEFQDSGLGCTSAS